MSVPTRLMACSSKVFRAAGHRFLLLFNDSLCLASAVSTDAPSLLLKVFMLNGYVVHLTLVVSHRTVGEAVKLGSDDSHNPTLTVTGT